jgi:hypothetical protein
MEYTVREEGGCTLVFGALPLSALGRLLPAKQKSKGIVLDPNVARMAGANLAWGAPADLARARDRYRDSAIRRTRATYLKMDENAVRWMAVGEQGLSSLAIFWNVYGDHWESQEEALPKECPYDPDDLRRCRLLLEQVPSVQERFARVMPNVSPTWARLVERWDELCATMDAEAPQWRDAGGRAPKTYAIMKQLLEG